MREKEERIEELLEQVGKLEREIRDEENYLFSKDDIREVRHSVFAEIERDLSEGEDIFSLYGHTEYIDEIRASLRAADNVGLLEDRYTYLLSAANALIELMCWIRTREDFTVE